MEAKNTPKTESDDHGKLSIMQKVYRLSLGGDFETDGINKDLAFGGIKLHSTHSIVPALIMCFKRLSFGIKEYTKTTDSVE